MKKLKKAERAEFDAIVARLTAEGSLWVEGSEYIGRASDGTIVNVASVDFPSLYLVRNPSPTNW